MPKYTDSETINLIFLKTKDDEARKKQLLSLMESKDRDCQEKVNLETAACARVAERCTSLPQAIRQIRKRLE